MKNAFNIFMMIVIGFISLTCSEAPELNVPNPPPGPGPSSGPKLVLTDEERLATLKRCSKTIGQLGDLKDETKQLALVEWLKAQPEFEEAGIEGGTVWAYFYDGRVVMIVPNWEGSDEEIGGRIAQGESGGRTIDKPAVARTSDLPKSNKGVLFHALGRGFTDDRTFLYNLFDASHTDYQVDVLDATVEKLMAVNDVGMFYIRTHGGLGILKPREQKRAVFGLWTTDTLTREKEEKYLPELNSNMLIYMNARQNTDDTTEWHYAISAEFVRYPKYMNFAADAFLYVDACNGMTPSADFFKKSMIGKAANGMATYIGWTGPKTYVEGTPTARFIFDRLLGTSAADPIQQPVQRPFDWPKVFDDMKKNNLGESAAGGKLAYESYYTTVPMLTPSIKYIWTADFESLIVLYGEFGEQPDDGKVTVDGVPAKIIDGDWMPNMIIAEIPTTGKGSYGDVVVSIRGNESNKVPLSEWTIPLNLSVDDVGFTTEVILNLKIRADVHMYRNNPGETPQFIRRDSLGMLANPDIPGWIFNNTSTGTYSVGGRRQTACTIDGCNLKQTESTFPRSGNLPYIPLEVGLGFSAYYKWAEDMRTIYVRVNADVPDVGIEYEYSSACPQAEPIMVNQSYASTFSAEIPTKGIQHLEIKLDENYNILSGQVSKTRDVEWGPCGPPTTVVTTAIWSGASPKSAPKNDTDARTANRAGN